MSVQFDARLGCDNRHTHFAEVRVGNAYQCTFGDARHIVDIAFNLGRIHVVAAADDQILAAAYDRNVTPVIDLAHITRLEITIGSEFFFGLFGHSPVAFKNIRAFNLDGSNLARGKNLAVIILHAQAHPRQRKAHRTAPPIAALVGVGSQHGGFRHAVTFQNGVPCFLLPVVEGFNQ